MKIMTINRILIALLICVLAGAILPYFFDNFSLKTVLMVGGLFLVMFLLLLKRGRITVHDWLVLFFIGIPFHDFKIMFGDFFLRITEVFFIPFLVWAVVQISTDKEEREKLIRLPVEYLILIFFCLFTLMSALFSANIFLSTYRTIVLLYLILMSFLISRILNDRERINLIVKVMITVSAAAGFFAIFQSFLPALQLFRSIPLAHFGNLTIFRSGVGWNNPNYFALYITMILPITYVLKIGNVFPEKKFLNTCFVLQLLGLLCSYSRLGIISISLTFIGILWVRGKRYLSSVIFIVLILLAVIAFLNMEYIYQNNPYLAASIFRIARLDIVSKNPLLIAGWRRDAWIANINMFLDRPILGVGPFMSTDMYSEYKPYDDIYPWEDLAVHNEYLSLLSERGLLGTVLFLLFLFVLASRAILYYKNNKSTPYGVLMLGLWASVMNFIWFSFGAATIYSVQFWVNVGIIFALYNFSKEAKGIKI